jgi:DNA-binding winged helix-turn-helix (wHTH) protein/TolB-like protein
MLLFRHSCCNPAMDSVEAPAKIFRFGFFEADATQNTLTRKGVPVKIQDQPFRVLLMLLKRPSEIVTREELRLKLWPEGTYVDFDGSLNVILKKLRAAINEDSDNPRFIETVPRRGYRFIAPVSIDDPAAKQEPVMPLVGSDATATGISSPPAQRIWPWALVLAAILIAFVAWRYTHRNARSVAVAQKVIAVLPFINEGAGADFDYLRYAIANELVTDLTHMRSVSVRPFSSTSRYGTQAPDPAAVGAELGVSHVVSGTFLLDNKNLRIDLELVDVARNQAVWREKITVSPQRLIELHDQLASRAVQGLLPAMNVVGVSPDAVPKPRDEQALYLFLHSLTIPLDPVPNQVAIKRLEESVALDNTYAPAWGELGSRYYIDYHYGSGGEAAVAKALDAYQRQSELDPDWPAVSTDIRAEQGDLNGAYDQAAEFLRRRPDVAMGHHSMSYVLRSAGLLDEADKQCETAVALDPGFNGFRSCAFSFILSGDYSGAQKYVRLDEHSGFGAMLRMMIALRVGNTASALAEADAVSKGGFEFAGLARMYLDHASPDELRKAAAQLEIEPKSSRDPETLYVNAAVLSFSGQGDAAIRQLRNAIRRNYCSVPAMDSDPLLDPIRYRADFAELRRSGVECQQRFRAHVKQETAPVH